MTTQMMMLSVWWWGALGVFVLLSVTIWREEDEITAHGIGGSLVIGLAWPFLVIAFLILAGVTAVSWAFDEE